MRSTTCEAPPEWMISVAGKLMPRFQRETLEGDLIENLRCNSGREYAWCIGQKVIGVIRSQMRDSFDLWLLAGEAAFLYLPIFLFYPRAAFLPMALLLVSTLALQRIRDAYIYPAEGSASEMAADTAAAMAFVIFLETVLRLYAPQLALPMGAAILAAVATILMSQWRMIFRREDPLDPKRRPLTERSIATWHAYALFALVYLPLGLTNISAVPGSHERDKFLGFAPCALLVMAHRLRNDNWRSIYEHIWPSVVRDTTIDELDHQLNILPVRNRASRFPADLIAEFFYFFVISWPLLMAGWEWASGDPAAASVDWLQVGINSGAILALAVLWIHIKRMARELGEALQEEIEARGSRI